jgi:WD40 repeat protein
MLKYEDRGRVFLFDTIDRTIVSELPVKVSSSFVIPNTELVCVLMPETEDVCIYNLYSGEFVKRLCNLTNSYIRRISPDGKVLVVSDFTTRGCRFIDVNTGETVKTIENCYDCYFSPDGTMAVLMNSLNSIVYTDTFEEIGQLRVQGSISFAAFSPDSSQIVYVEDRSSEKEIYLVDLNDLNSRKRIRSSRFIMKESTTSDFRLMFYYRVRPKDSTEVALVDVFDRTITTISVLRYSEAVVMSPDSSMMVIGNGLYSYPDVKYMYSIPASDSIDSLEFLRPSTILL